MKYISIDRLCDFEFHDSEWSFISWENGNLLVRIIMLNIHKDTEQNDTGKDMEIGVKKDIQFLECLFL